MFIINCKSGQTVKIEMAAPFNPDMPARHLFNQGPIEVLVGRINESEVRLAITLPPQLVVKDLEQGY